MYLFAEKTGLEYTSALGSVNLDVLVSELVGGGSRRSLSLTEFFGYTGSNYCGTGWMDTFNACMTSKPCPGGQNSECADGQSCFGGITCPTPTTYGTGAAPVPNLNFCGPTYDDAEANKCGNGAQACPGGTADECPGSQDCFKVSACPGAAYLATEQESNASVKAVGSSPDASFGNPSSLSASLPDGTYSSYLLHADSPAQSTITALLTGSIRFPGQEVVGIMFSSGALSSTDSIFGLSSTQYGGSSANRGWEVQSEFQDFLTVSESCEVDVSALTCPATTATECAITANLGSEIGAVGAAYSGDEVHDDPFPNINTGTPLNGPNGRDDTTAFLVGGDYLSQIAAEVEGGMVILGDMDIDATGANSLVYAGYGSGIIPHDGTDVIKVGGNINLDRDVAVMDFASGGGIIRYGGSLTGTGTFKMGPQAQAIQDPNLDLSAYVKVLEDLKAKSEYWATFTPNGDFEGYGYGNQATFQAGADNACIQVFTIEAAELDANWGINVKFDASLDDKTILINVNAPPGGVVTVNNLGFIDGAGNLNYAFSSSVIQNIIWNFHDATVLNLGLCDPTSNHCTSGEFMGSIIAPKANIVNMALPGQSGRFATSGTVVHKWGGSEFHNYPFNPPCPLPPPDNLPVPPECTTLPPGQTDAPTSSPKPQGCPTGVTLVGQVGSLGWVSGDGSIPIEIVSADDTTVTFTVSSTWNTANVDKLYTQLEEDANGLPSTACYLEEAVGMSNGETYTAKCSMYSKTAIVDIYVIDEDLSKQNTGKTINVPDCCHSEAGTPQAMHYVAMLQCTPQPCPPGQTSTRRLEGRGNLRAN
uniref:Uncharacterized protein n=1 Tax=Craspedostauros australis TaxID=1486917 RepID=A0A7R9X0C7_9STRA